MESNMDLLKEHEALLQEHRESTRAVNEEALQTPRSGAAPALSGPGGAPAAQRRLVGRACGLLSSNSKTPKVKILR